MKTAEDLEKLSLTELIALLKRHNPFGGYTTKNITKPAAIATLLRYQKLAGLKL